MYRFFCVFVLLEFSVGISFLLYRCVLLSLLEYNITLQIYIWLLETYKYVFRFRCKTNFHAVFFGLCYLIFFSHTAFCQKLMINLFPWSNSMICIENPLGETSKEVTCVLTILSKKPIDTYTFVWHAIWLTCSTIQTSLIIGA